MLIDVVQAFDDRMEAGMEAQPNLVKPRLHPRSKLPHACPQLTETSLDPFSKLPHSIGQLAEPCLDTISKLPDLRADSFNSSGEFSEASGDLVPQYLYPGVEVS